MEVQGSESVPGGEVILAENPTPDPDPVDKGALSPLTGSYLLILLAEPHSHEDREIILHRLNKGLLAWDVDSSHVDLNCELLNLTNSCPEGDEARNGEKLIQWASENLVVEVLIHSQVNTLQQCMKNLLASFTRHRHIIHAGYTFQGSGSWILQDGTFSLSDYLELWGEPEVQRILSAYKGDIRVSMHCASEGGWTQDRFDKEHFSKLCQITMNSPDNPGLSAHSAGVTSFVEYISKMLIPTPLKEILEPSEIVGNIRFSHPTLYVFPGGQGDAALFGINGFNMLIDGGFARKACFWDFTRHLDRLDAVLLTRMNTNAVGGLGAVIQRKMMNQVYPQIGHFFGNVMERRQSKVLALPGDQTGDGADTGEHSGENGGDSSEFREKLLISLQDEGQRIFENLRGINLKPHLCFRENVIEPINLYHKVGHGKLDLYILNPAKDSREVKEFLTRWHTEKTSTTTASKVTLKSSSADGKDFQFPVLNLVSICALLVWQPANPRDSITRILFPGSTPQHKIFEALQKLKHLEFLKYPVCSAKTIAASNRSKLKSEKIISEAKHQLSKTSESRALSSHPLSKTQSSSSAALATSRSISTSRAPPASSSSSFISRTDKRVEESSAAKDSKDQSSKDVKEEAGKVERSTSRRLHSSASRTIGEKAEKGEKGEKASSGSNIAESKKHQVSTKSASRSASSTVSRTSSTTRLSANKVSSHSNTTSKQISPTSPTKQHKPESKLKRPQSAIIAAHGKSSETPPLTPPKTVKESASASRRVIEYKAKVKAVSAKTDSGNKTPLQTKPSADSKKRSTTTRPSSTPTSAAPPHKSPPHPKRSITSAGKKGQPGKLIKDSSKDAGDSSKIPAAVSAGAVAATIAAATTKIPSPTKKEPVNGEEEEAGEEPKPVPATNGNGLHDPQPAEQEPETEAEEEEAGGEGLAAEIEEDIIKESQGEDEQPLSLPSSIYPPMESGSELSSLDHISITEEDEPIHHSSFSKETEFQDEETTAATETIQGLESEHEEEEEEYLIVEKDELTDNESKGQQPDSKSHPHSPPPTEEEDRAETPLVTDPAAQELEQDPEGEQTPEIGQSPKQSIISSSSPPQDIKPVHPLKDELIISTQNELLTKNQSPTLGLSQLPDEPEVGRTPQEFQHPEETKSLEALSASPDFLHGDQPAYRKISSDTEIPLEKVESLHNVPTSSPPPAPQPQHLQPDEADPIQQSSQPQESSLPSDKPQSEQDPTQPQIPQQSNQADDLQSTTPPHQQPTTNPEQIPQESQQSQESSKDKPEQSSAQSPEPDLHQTSSEQAQQIQHELITENASQSQAEPSTPDFESDLHRSDINNSDTHHTQLSSSPPPDTCQAYNFISSEQSQPLEDIGENSSGSNIDQLQPASSYAEELLKAQSESQGADNEVLESDQSTQNVISNQPEKEEETSLPPKPPHSTPTQSFIDSTNTKPEETKDEPSEIPKEPSSMQIQSDLHPSHSESDQPEESLSEQIQDETQDRINLTSAHVQTFPEKVYSKDDGVMANENQDKDQIQEQVSSIKETPLSPKLHNQEETESSTQSITLLHQTQDGDGEDQKISSETPASKEEQIKVDDDKYEQISEKTLHESSSQPQTDANKEEEEEEEGEMEQTQPPQPTHSLTEESLPSLKDELESTMEKDSEKLGEIENHSPLHGDDTLEEVGSSLLETQDAPQLDVIASSQTVPDNKDHPPASSSSEKKESGLSQNQKPGDLPPPTLESKDTMDDASSLSFETQTLAVETTQPEIQDIKNLDSVHKQPEFDQTYNETLDDGDSNQNNLSISASEADQAEEPEREPCTTETILDEAVSEETAKSSDNVPQADTKLVDTPAPLEPENLPTQSTKPLGETETLETQIQDTEPAQRETLEADKSETCEIQELTEESSKTQISTTSQLSPLPQTPIQPSSQEESQHPNHVPLTKDDDEASVSKESALSDQDTKQELVEEEPTITGKDSEKSEHVFKNEESIAPQTEDAPQETSAPPQSSDLQADLQSDAQDQSSTPPTTHEQVQGSKTEQSEAPAQNETISDKSQQELATKPESPESNIANQPEKPGAEHSASTIPSTSSVKPVSKDDEPEASQDLLPQDDQEVIEVREEAKEEQIGEESELSTSDKPAHQPSSPTPNLSSDQAESGMKSEIGDPNSEIEPQKLSESQDLSPPKASQESLQLSPSNVEEEKKGAEDQTSTSLSDTKEVKESEPESFMEIIKSEIPQTDSHSTQPPPSSVASSKLDSSSTETPTDTETTSRDSQPPQEVKEEIIIPTKLQPKQTEFKECTESSDEAKTGAVKSPASEQEEVQDPSVVLADSEFECPASIDELKGSSSSPSKLDEILETVDQVSSDLSHSPGGDQRGEDIKSEHSQKSTVPEGKSSDPSEIDLPEVQEDVVLPVTDEREDQQSIIAEALFSDIPETSVLESQPTQSPSSALIQDREADPSTDRIKTDFIEQDNAGASPPTPTECNKVQGLASSNISSMESHHTNEESTSVPLQDDPSVLQKTDDKCPFKESHSSPPPPLESKDDLVMSTKEESIELSRAIESGALQEAKEISSEHNFHPQEPAISSKEPELQQPERVIPPPASPDSSPPVAPTDSYISHPLILDTENPESEGLHSGPSEPEKLLSHDTKPDTFQPLGNKDLDQIPAPQSTPTLPLQTPAPQLAKQESLLKSSSESSEKAPLSPLPPHHSNLPSSDSEAGSEKGILDSKTTTSQQLSSSGTDAVTTDTHPPDAFHSSPELSSGTQEDTFEKASLEDTAAQKSHTFGSERKLSIEEPPKLGQHSPDGGEESLKDALEKASEEITNKEGQALTLAQVPTKAPVELSSQLSEQSQHQPTRQESLAENSTSTPPTLPPIPQEPQTDSHQSSLHPDTSSGIPADSVPALPSQHQHHPQGSAQQSQEINQEIPDSEETSSQVTQSPQLAPTLRDMSTDISSAIYQSFISSQSEIQSDPASSSDSAQIPDKTKKSLGQEEEKAPEDGSRDSGPTATPEIIRDVQQLSPATIEASIDKLHTEIDQVIDNAESAIPSPTKPDQLVTIPNSFPTAMSESKTGGEDVQEIIAQTLQPIPSSDIKPEITSQDKLSEQTTATLEIRANDIAKTIAESGRIETISESKILETASESEMLATVTHSKISETATESTETVVSDSKTVETAAESTTVDTVSDSKIVETVSELKTFENVSDSKTVEILAESRVIESTAESETVSDAKTIETSNELKTIETIETTSDSKTIETTSDSKTVETTSDSKTVETTSDSKTAETTSDLKTVETNSESKTSETSKDSTAIEAARNSITLEALSESKTVETFSSSKILESAVSETTKLSSKSNLIASSLSSAEPTEQKLTLTESSKTEQEVVKASARITSTETSSVSPIPLPATTLSPTHQEKQSRESREIMKEFIATSDVMVAVKDGMEKLVLKEGSHPGEDAGEGVAEERQASSPLLPTASLPTGDYVEHDCVEAASGNLPDLPAQHLLKVIEDVETEVLVVEDNKFIRPLPYEESLTSQEGIEHLLRESRTIVDTERKEKKIKEEGGTEKIPSAIPPKLPRESREVIRTPDEVADLPVHEEVEPGTYETDEVVINDSETDNTRHSPPQTPPVNQPVPPSDSPKPTAEDPLLPDLSILPIESIVTKIDAAVSPVLESLLGQVSPKSFPPSDPEEEEQEQAPGAIQKQSSAPPGVDSLILTPPLLSANLSKDPSELQATTTTSVVITPSTPPVQIVDKSEFHYTPPAEREAGVLQSGDTSSPPATAPVSVDTPESKPEVPDVAKTSPLSLPSSDLEGERKLSASDESSTSSATPLTAISKEKDVALKSSILEDSSPPPEAPPVPASSQHQKLFSLPGDGDEDEEEEEEGSRSGEEPPGSESPLTMGAIRSGLLTAATTLSAALISQSPEQLASLQSSPTHEGAAPSEGAPTNEHHSHHHTQPSQSTPPEHEKSPPASPQPVSSRSDQAPLSDSPLRKASPPLLTPEQVVSQVIEEAGEQVVQETAKLAHQLLSQVEEEIQSSSSILYSSSSQLPESSEFSSITSSRHQNFTSSKEQTEQLISSLSNQDDFFSSSDYTSPQFPPNLNISHHLHKSAAQKESITSSHPVQPETGPLLPSSSQSSSSPQPETLSTSSQIIHQSKSQPPPAASSLSSQDSQTTAFSSTTASITSRDSPDTGISSLSSGQTLFTTSPSPFSLSLSMMHSEKSTSQPTLPPDSKQEDKLELESEGSGESCTQQSAFIESSQKDRAGPTSPPHSSSVFSTFSTFTTSSPASGELLSSGTSLRAESSALVSKQVTQISSEHQKLMESQEEKIETFSSSSSSSFFSSSKRGIDQLIESVQTESASAYMFPAGGFSSDSGPQSSFPIIGKQSSPCPDHPPHTQLSDKTQIELEIEEESCKQSGVHYMPDKYIPPGFHPSQHELMDEGSYSSGDFSDSQLSTVAGGKETLPPDEDNYNFYRESVSGISQDFENGNFPVTLTPSFSSPAPSSNNMTGPNSRLLTSTTSPPENGNFPPPTTTHIIISSASSIQTGSTSTTSSVEQDNKPVTVVSSGSSFMSTEFTSTSAPSSSSRQKEAEGDDILKTWGKPLGLPPVAASQAEPSDEPPAPEDQRPSEQQPSSTAPPEHNPKTPKKDKSVDRGGSSSRNAAGTPAKSHRTGRSHHRSTKHVNPIYLDLAYVPHHGNSNYCDSEFFRLVRARYYVFSGLEPSRQVFDGLLQGKQQWDDKNLEVTIIPTYDTDTLGYWVVDSEDALAEAHIDLAPSASRCTINLQDHETSCAAYRLEF